MSMAVGVSLLCHSGTTSIPARAKGDELKDVMQQKCREGIPLMFSASSCQTAFAVACVCVCVWFLEWSGSEIRSGVNSCSREGPGAVYLFAQLFCFCRLIANSV